jgi:hypothetical protein
VLYHPKALAVHDHLEMTIGDLVRRARLYGGTQLLLLRKHPHLLGDGTGPFGSLDESATERIQDFVEQRRDQVQDAVRALERLDTFDLTPFLSTSTHARGRAADVMDVVARVVPEVFWFFLFQGFLEAREYEKQSGSATTGKAQGLSWSESKKLAGANWGVSR